MKIHSDGHIDWRLSLVARISCHYKFSSKAASWSHEKITVNCIKCYGTNQIVVFISKHHWGMLFKAKQQLMRCSSHQVKTGFCNRTEQHASIIAVGYRYDKNMNFISRKLKIVAIGVPDILTIIPVVFQSYCQKVLNCCELEVV